MKGLSEHTVRIKAFMEKAGQTIPSKPCLPNQDIRRLRATLILEEAAETISGLGFDISIKQVSASGGPAESDSLKTDLSNVSLEPNGKENLVEIIDGITDLSVVGWGTALTCGCPDEPFQKEVDEANLRKFGPGSYKREDGKWIKPPDFRPPNIQGVIDRIQREN